MTQRYTIEKNRSFWTIHDRSKKTSIDLLKTPLDDGADKTQDEWAQYSREAIDKGEFAVGSFPFYHNEIFMPLHRERNGSQKRTVADVQKFIRTQMFNSLLVTLTRVQSQPRGKDNVIHNYGLADEYTVRATIVGPCEWAITSKRPAVYQAILGSKNLREINAVHKWLTGNNAFLWCLNKKPEAIEERVAGFYADSGGVVLCCDWYPRNSNAALGVRESAEGATKKFSNLSELTTAEVIECAKAYMSNRKRVEFQRDVERQLRRK